VKESKLIRMLDADEAAKVAPLPASDVETPTTSLSTATSQSTASIHLPGVAPAAQPNVADTIPDPVPVRKEK
jgi:hypothetical protein